MLLDNTTTNQQSSPRAIGHQTVHHQFMLSSLPGLSTYPERRYAFSYRKRKEPLDDARYVYPNTGLLYKTIPQNVTPGQNEQNMSIMHHDLRHPLKGLHSSVLVLLILLHLTTLSPSHSLSISSSSSSPKNLSLRRRSLDLDLARSLAS